MDARHKISPTGKGLNRLSADCNREQIIHGVCKAAPDGVRLLPEAVLVSERAEDRQRHNKYREPNKHHDTAFSSLPSTSFIRVPLAVSLCHNHHQDPPQQAWLVAYSNLICVSSLAILPDR